MGPSGSGKTTLLNLLGGLDVPSRGSITVAGDEITHLSGGKLTRWRARHVGFIFQMYNLIPVLSAFRNVELPLLLAPLSKAERKRQVETVLGWWACRSHGPQAARSCRAGSSSASPSPARSWPTPPSCSATSPRATSTARAPTTSWSCSRSLVSEMGRPSSWSPTTRARRSAPTPPCISTRGCFDAMKFLPLFAGEPVPPEAADGPDHGLVRRGPVPARPAARRARRLQPGHGRGAGGPADRHQQDLDHPALALRQPRQGGEHPGRQEFTYANWFGGVYKDPKNFFAQFAIDIGELARRLRRVRGAGGRSGRPSRRPPGRDRGQGHSPNVSAGRWGTASPSRVRAIPATGSSTCGASTPASGPTTTSPSSGSSGST